jgi:translation initiation factor 2-alpha kinase 1
MKRSESLGSFNGRDLHQLSELASCNGNLSSQLPFFDYMFYSPSRFRADFLSKLLIGKGAFGVVYRSRHRIDGNEYALKKIKFSFRNATELERAYTRVVREVRSLAALDHPNIVRYNQAWFEPCRKDTTEGDDLPLLEDDQTHTDATLATKSEGLQFGYDEPSMDHHNITFESFYPSREGVVAADDIFSKKETLSPPGCGSNVYNDLPPSPVNMSYLEYALKNKSPQTPTKEKERESQLGKDMANMRNIFTEMFNEENRKFEMALFIQMQLCQQRTLEDWLWSDERVKSKKVNLAEACGYFKQIVGAMSHVHDKNLIHRDLKPPNIFLSTDGVIKIGDFGLAKFVNDTIQSPKTIAIAVMDYESSNSSHTSGVGTYLYASPEQLADSQYDARSDIFSLGVILFEMLHPVSTKSERAYILSDLRRGKVPDDMMTKYPKQMELVKRCVNEKCAARPTAREVLEAVTNFDEILPDNKQLDEKAKMQEQIMQQQETILKLQQELAALKLK